MEYRVAFPHFSILIELACTRVPCDALTTVPLLGSDSAATRHFLAKAEMQKYRIVEDYTYARIRENRQ